MKDQKNVGYIGLGNIGKPSAERLLLGDFNVFVYDVFQPAVDELVEKGASGCDSVAQLASQCSHIGICVRDDAQVEELLYGDSGIFKNAAKDTVLTIHSTVTQANLLKWAEEAKAHNLHLIDAPITGGAARAEKGTLCYMVGGDAKILERCRPIFNTSAEKIVHAGQLGTGIALKLCNNFMQYGEFVLMAEATRLAEACGLSSDVLREVGVSNGVVSEAMHLFVSGRNALALNGGEEMMQYFTTMGKLGRKDLECVLETAAEYSVRLPTAEYLHNRIEDVFQAKDESSPVA